MEGRIIANKMICPVCGNVCEIYLAHYVCNKCNWKSEKIESVGEMTLEKAKEILQYRRCWTDAESQAICFLIEELEKIDESNHNLLRR